MVVNVTHEQIQMARRKVLYDFCIRNHSNLFKKEGNSIRFLNNHSISIKRGYAGYLDFATGETGNSVDFLTKYLNYDVVSAVKALLGADIPIINPATKKPAVFNEKDPTFILPSKKSGPFRQMFAYLNKTRKIPVPLIQQLVNQQLLYQEASHNDIVFVNPNQSIAEIHGTNTVVRFKQTMVKPGREMDFVWYKSKSLHGLPKAIYICESMIDALSLFTIHQYESQLLQKQGRRVKAEQLNQQILYASMSGIANTQRIENILDHSDVSVYLSVDNDSAGNNLISKYKRFQMGDPLNPRYRKLIWNLPDDGYKDWNDMLCDKIDYYVNEENLVLNI